MSPGPFVAESYSWPAYRLFVIRELERIATVLLDMDERLDAQARVRAQDVQDVNVRLQGIERQLAEARGVETERKRTQRKMATLLGFLGAALLEGIKLLFQLIFHK